MTFGKYRLWLSHRALCLGAALLMHCTMIGAADMVLVGVYTASERALKVQPQSPRMSGVELTRAGKKLGLSADARVIDNDVIETGPMTAVLIRYAEGHQVLILPNSKVRMGSLFLFLGELLVKARGVFQIETNFVTAGVEGTEFLVRAAGEGHAVDVIVTEGAVICRSNADMWPAVRVAASEQLRAKTPNGHADPDFPEVAGTVILRGKDNSRVQKQPARGFDLDRIQQLGKAIARTAENS